MPGVFTALPGSPDEPCSGSRRETRAKLTFDMRELHAHGVVEQLVYNKILRNLLGSLSFQEEEDPAL